VPGRRRGAVLASRPPGQARGRSGCRAVASPWWAGDEPRPSGAPQRRLAITVMVAGVRPAGEPRAISGWASCSSWLAGASRSPWSRAVSLARRYSRPIEGPGARERAGNQPRRTLDPGAARGLVDPGSPSTRRCPPGGCASRSRPLLKLEGDLQVARRILQGHPGPSGIPIVAGFDIDGLEASRPTRPVGIPTTSSATVPVPGRKRGPRLATAGAEGRGGRGAPVLPAGRCHRARGWAPALSVTQVRADAPDGDPDRRGLFRRSSAT